MGVDPKLLEALGALQETALARVGQALVRYLDDGGYAPHVATTYARAIVHFAYWLDRTKRSIGAVDERLVWAFAERHLPRCRCRESGSRSAAAVRPALRHLLVVMRAQGLAPERGSRFPEPVSAELSLFRAYLDETCGLAKATQTSRMQWVGAFLEDVFGSTPIDTSRLNPKDVTAFIVRRARHYCPGTTRVIGSALRSYLRFAALTREADPRLSAAVPTVAGWKLAGLPKSLSDEEAGSVVSAIDRSSVLGRRDYAMVLCMLDLGLRASEVAGLRIEDLDGRERAIRVARTKVRGAEALPLSSRLECALTEYLEFRQPLPSSSGPIFVRHRAPFDRSVSSEMVRGAARRAFARVGLTRWTGTHVLRHTAATRLVRAGATLKDVADVLGHRCLDTTAIYAKVDLPRLRSVALPWPSRRTTR